MKTLNTVGIIGAGKISMALSKKLLAAGYEVLISSSRAPQEFSLILDVMVPGAQGVWTQDLIDRSDIIILALPLSKVGSLPVDELAGKTVIDATNHWLEVDGHMPQLQEFAGTSSEYVAAQLPGVNLVKAFNHLGYHDVDQLARPAGAIDRIGIAFAGPVNTQTVVSELVNAVGFDPVFLGDLSETKILEGGNPLFGLAVKATELQEIVESHNA